MPFRQRKTELQEFRFDSKDCKSFKGDCEGTAKLFIRIRKTDIGDILSKTTYGRNDVIAFINTIQQFSKGAPRSSPSSCFQLALICSIPLPMPRAHVGDMCNTCFTAALRIVHRLSDMTSGRPDPWMHADASQASADACHRDVSV